jgi:anti-anti-sigma factor
MSEQAPFLLQIEDRDDAVHIRAAGELDPSTAPDVVAALRRYRGRDVVMDLSAVSFTDSAIVRALVEERHHARLDGSDLRVTGARGQVRRAFLVTGVEDLFDFGEEPAGGR